MDLSSKVLGRNAVEKLSQARTEALFTVGSDSLSREELAEVGCYNFVAARRVSAALSALGPKSLRDLFENYPPRDLALPRVGVISLFVVGCAFECKRIGGDAPLEAYVRRHSEKIVTFHRLKTQVRKEEELASQKRRRQRR